MRRLAPLFSLCAGLVLGCGTPTGVPERFTLGEPFDLAVGEGALSRDGRTAIHFTRVVGDSRCPPDVVCVWAGEARIELEVVHPVGVPTIASPSTAASSAAVFAPPITELLVGAPQPTIVNGLAVEALDLTAARTPGSDGVRVQRARLRVSLAPAPD